MVGVCMLYIVGVKEKEKVGLKWIDFVVCLMNFSTSWGIFFSFTEALHSTMYYLYEVHGMYYVYGCRVSWWHDIVIPFMCMQ